MNRRFHPALLYLSLLLLIILFSWIGSIIEMRHGQMTLNSLIGAQGVRWLVRNAAATVSMAPIGNAVLIMLMVGTGKGSGFVRAFSSPKDLSPKEHNALLLSIVIMLLILSVFFFGIFSPSHLLLGVTGTLKGSPLADGAVFLLTILFVIPAVVYGFSTDTFRRAADCIRAFLSVAVPTAGLLLTMLVAAQLLETFKYANLDVLFGLSGKSMHIIEFAVYWLPLPFFAFGQKSGRHI